MDNEVLDNVATNYTEKTALTSTESLARQIIKLPFRKC